MIYNVHVGHIHVTVLTNISVAQIINSNAATGESLAKYIVKLMTDWSIFTESLERGTCAKRNSLA